MGRDRRHSTLQAEVPASVLRLVGSTPDPKRDLSLLQALGDTGDPAAGELASKLCAEERWRSWTFEKLLPKLERAGAPMQEGCLSTRAMNSLGRAGVKTWADLAMMSPESLLLLPNLGPGTLHEIFAVAVGEWARAFIETDPPLSVLAEADEPSPERTVEDLADAFEGLEKGTPDFEILRRHRLAAEHAPTLRELGAEAGISGERVRQRESRVRKAIAGQMLDHEWPVRIAVDLLGKRLGPAAPLRELYDVLTEVDTDGRAFAGAPHRRALLLHLAGYRVSGAWVHKVAFDTRTDALLAALTKDGPVSLERCLLKLNKLGLRDGVGRDWIGSRSGFRVVEKLLVRNSQATDVAVAQLRDAGEPLAVEEIFARTGTAASLATFRSQIQHDDRFLRRGVRSYGLREWGGEHYTTLEGKMIAEIERHGGAMDLDDLIDIMTERFHVAEGSVLHRVRAPQFKVGAAGQVSRCIAPLVIPQAPLALTHNCFHLDSGWAVKLRVTRSMLRGATSRLPLAFAREVGLQFGTSRALAWSSGELRAYWPRYSASAASLSSLRGVAEAYGAIEGDRLFAIHCGKDRLDFRLVEKRRCEASSGFAHLALECGLEPGRESRGQVLAALGLDPNLAHPEFAMRSRLNERHEGCLSGLVTPY
jgi:hypothetical protein